MKHRGINAYKKRNVQQEIEQADPHKITLMLMQGVLDKIGIAKGCMERKAYDQKSEHLSKATSIIVYLRDTLDLSAGEAVGNDLFALYNFMLERVQQANLDNSTDLLDEVAQVMMPIKTAWAQIPEATKQEVYQQKQQTAVNAE